MGCQSSSFMFFIALILLNYRYSSSSNSDSNNQPSGTGDDHHGNHGSGGGGPSGNHPDGCGESNGGKLVVIISFDSMNPPSITFFQKQVKPIYKDFSKCVQWHFIPCSTSQIVNDVLHCEQGVMECQIDVLHACAAHYYEKEEYKLGNFFICMMTDVNQYTKGETCAKEAGLDWKILNACQPSKDAGTWCDNRFKQLNALHEPTVPGVIYNWKYNKEADDASITCLKSEICNEIKKNNMQCAACGNSGGGSDGGTSGTPSDSHQSSPQAQHGDHASSPGGPPAGPQNPPTHH